MSLSDESRRSSRAGTGSERADEWRPRGSVSRFVVRHERTLWAVAVASMVVDVPLTAYGLSVGLREANPVAVAAMGALGLAGLVVLKAVALGVGLGGWAVLPRRYAHLVPLAFAGPSVAVVLSNLWLIARLA